VLMEQRGTFRTRPNLECPELGQASYNALIDGFDADATEAAERAALAGCISRLSSDGVDLASYNNVENGADVNDVRMALGYDQVVLYGASYGTLLAQFVMRDYPESLAGVVLDGVESTETRNWVEDRDRRAQWGLDKMSSLCAAQADCAAAY
ncbi:alpha/beta fold hydrolase, partial [Cribrihabitans sp. XS_ASV171]